MSVERPTLRERYGLADGEDFLPRGVRMGPSLGGTGLTRNVQHQHYVAAPRWVVEVALALNGCLVTPWEYERVRDALLARED